MSSASAGDWIMKPELSTAHLDIEDRDLEYEKRVQLQPHIVYLALSSEVKVGVTSNLGKRVFEEQGYDPTEVQILHTTYFCKVTRN